jgi:homoserine acetyltransferase
MCISRELLKNTSESASQKKFSKKIEIKIIQSNNSFLKNCQQLLSYSIKKIIEGYDFDCSLKIVKIVKIHEKSNFQIDISDKRRGILLKLLIKPLKLLLLAIINKEDIFFLLTKCSKKVYQFLIIIKKNFSALWWHP